MPDRNDVPYLVVRERQSRALAAEAGDVAVRLAHLNMAKGYAVRIAAVGPAMAIAQSKIA